MPKPPKESADILQGVEILQTDSTLEFGVTSSARRRAAIKRAAFVFFSGVVILTALLLPDWFGRYDESDPSGGLLFIGAIIGIAALLAFALGASRWLREERWVLDLSEETLTHARRLKGRAWIEESIGLEDVDTILTDDHTRRLSFRIRATGQLVPMHDASTDEEFDALVTALSRMCARASPPLELQRESR